MIRIVSAVSVGVLATLGFYLGGDDKPKDSVKPVEPSIQVPSVGVISAQENDRRLARWLSVDNNGMIGCAEWAADKTDNAEIKKLAGTIASHHKRIQETFNTLISAQPPSLQPFRGAVTAATTATLIRDDGATRNGQIAFRPTDFLDVKERVCNSLHQKAEREFRNLKNTEFDRSFVTHMLFAHEAMIETLEAVKGDATPAFQTQLADLEHAAQKHLTELQRLHKIQATVKTR